jgi:uncharacterized protein YfaS (alpha-2-macroglobulin family)
MQKTGSANPEVQLQAEEYVATGYQRLLTFEVPGGGFSLFGQAPARAFLTAYGLMEFTDMARVYPVDEAVMARTAQWLLSQQQADGTWDDSGQSEHWRIDSAVPTTAYITWALIEAGYADTPEVQAAVAYLAEHASEVEDAYSLALVANALAAYAPDDPMTKAVVDRLYDMRIEEDDVVYWPISGSSFMGAAGESGGLETTALAAIALMRANAHPEAVSGALAYLIQGKDAWGTWSTTQATILSLKALLMASERTGSAEGPATVRVSLNNEMTREVVVDESNTDVVHTVTFDRGFSPSGKNRIQIDVEGGGNLMYQVATEYYVPWEAVPDTPETEEVTVDVTVQLNQQGVVKMALIDLGVPPGFSVETEDLSRLVEKGAISRYELTGRQIIIYVEDLSSEAPLTFSYRLRARFPMRAHTPPSGAYDYYNPTDMAVRAPLEVTVD